MIADFETEAAALAFVRTILQRDDTIVQGWALAAEDDEGETIPIAAGRELVARAVEQQPARIDTAS
jgi:hypothetical protein